MSNFKKSEMNKLTNYLSNLEKRILANFEEAQSFGGIFGDRLDVITPEDTGALIDSKLFTEQVKKGEIELNISYGNLDVAYGRFVEAWDPPINWSKSTTSYHFLSEYFHLNADQILKELTK